MDYFCLTLSICAFLVTGYMCIPSEDKGTSSSFDGFNCSETINCTDVKHKPVCGSDGVTYDSMCHLNQEYQRNVCELGNFNPIAFVRNGNCTDDGDDDVDAENDE